MARDRLWLYRISQRRAARRFGNIARQTLSRETRRGNCQAFPQIRELLLERWYVLLADLRLTGRLAPAPAEDRESAGQSASVRFAEVCQASRRDLSQVPEHLDRFRRAGTRSQRRGI